MKHKPWRAAAETAETAETAPDQNHNIPEISNFGDIIISSNYCQTRLETLFLFIICYKCRKAESSFNALSQDRNVTKTNGHPMHVYPG